MAIIIKGDNKGIAVDGNLHIDKLDFSLGQGVKSVSGVNIDAEDAEVVETPQIPTIDEREEDYPPITKAQTVFFENTFNVTSKECASSVQEANDNSVGLIMHRIYGITLSWQPTDSTSARKWRILYEYLRRNKIFIIQQKQRYTDYVKAVVAYCFPNVSSTYNNNLSKINLPDEYAYWSNDDKRLYLAIKDALSFE